MLRKQVCVTTLSDPSTTLTTTYSTDHLYFKGCRKKGYVWIGVGSLELENIFLNSISKLVKGRSALLRFSVGFHDNREKAGNSATY